ncbi:N-formylglutamate deformylase [Sphingomonas sp. CFBP 13720]|uniref:N-formylglutamate deformylase n=1 Tax=Sphingomonas sp. CFBP 13720 TaxID=2775302 RepID=UPI0017823DFE|nr:N-formylglutamate deformylase [Sphingomonas sp. CFBP 13720]MBD8679872.1 N-formylglutamate deformylase [Sphingomonas sp. CFBP 13720]
MNGWLSVQRGEAPLIIAIPHAGTMLPDELLGRFVSPWQARKDADWWVDKFYAFATGLGATIVATAVSRSVIDVNRDPGGVSLYPGQATTELCPTTDFDGNLLYHDGQAPDPSEVAERRARYFDPYHAALVEELYRLRSAHNRVVLYDAHSIRSHVPRLFAGSLPVFNIGTNNGETCAAELEAAVVAACAASGSPNVLNGRFRGGWTTRHYGQPETGIHAVQMELAMRSYLIEPATFTPKTWPAPLERTRTAETVRTLSSVLNACIDWTCA